ncbi:transcriptional regulator, XRE family [Alkaliphilus metalliredigens QYMF]|uniref:Transcriptional regulator, XRE family n=1 Tax=Alkaliphilus metalliredigens (strain QYMF) TaxID=293826 RepID=A6TRE6_ALKMQ|nr:helix-turn-helix transcriptional regulator [Alkaliphilus metalliredigens]ABR48764.1 transcriptional regulator, XRE family [Alkaliphilus metalliredigens QYMF]
MYEKLRNIRNEKSITALEMANMLGLKTPAAYYKKETGTIKFSLEEAEKIAKFLGLPIEEIFFKTEVSETATTEG